MSKTANLIDLALTVFLTVTMGLHGFLLSCVYTLAVWGVSAMAEAYLAPAKPVVKPVVKPVIKRKRKMRRIDWLELAFFGTIALCCLAGLAGALLG